MASRLDVKGVLQKAPLFQQLSDIQLDEVFQATTEIRVSKGELLFSKGDMPTGIHLVVIGQIKLGVINPQGQEKVLEMFGPRQTFGEAVVFLDRAYPVFAQALVDSVVLHIEKQAIFNALSRDVSIAKKMLAGLSLRLHELVLDVESYSLSNGLQRVIGFLLNADIRGEDGNTGYIELPASKNVIASRLNLTPESLSRTLNQLSNEGLINVENRIIHLLDIAKLRTHQ
ncbi:Crp/Fnr family transcriptional regulator [Leeia sp. TBRC 13508]|uniref:Crp/Fnr family transcriptional regulator n=1 Tax=Leeia speluncae TaxID=2884804 RepID=A0ABS8D8L0_9NEIS|nr:Crp/Fnr family transcriptional regulator [Leeia speluncae]MCB6184568.1 Crp/Fnr family transcriptional regulator [Leeia speluncae]